MGFANSGHSNTCWVEGLWSLGDAVVRARRRYLSAVRRFASVASVRLASMKLGVAVTQRPRFSSPLEVGLAFARPVGSTSPGAASSPRLRSFFVRPHWRLDFVCVLFRCLLRSPMQLCGLRVAHRCLLRVSRPPSSSSSHAVSHRSGNSQTDALISNTNRLHQLHSKVHVRALFPWCSHARRDLGGRRDHLDRVLVASDGSTGSRCSEMVLRRSAKLHSSAIV